MIVPVAFALHKCCAQAFSPCSAVFELMTGCLQGKLQGPCSISSFRLWLMRMKQTPELDDERREFLKCMVWRKGMNRREPLERLLALADAEAAKQMSNKADEA